MSGRKPDYVVKVGLSNGGYARRCGAAWRLSGGGGIAIRIDPGIAIVGAHDVRITLWPSDDAQTEVVEDYS